MNQPKRCFVIMPYAEENNGNFKIYQTMIKPVVETYGYKSFWAGEIDYFGDITLDILDLLNDTDLVVADVSDNNTTIFNRQDVQRLLFHDGLILLARKDRKLPKEIPASAYVMYLNDSIEINQFKNELKKFIEDFEQHKFEKQVEDVLSETVTQIVPEAETSLPESELPTPVKDDSARIVNQLDESTETVEDQIEKGSDEIVDLIQPTVESLSKDLIQKGPIDSLATTMDRLKQLPEEVALWERALNEQIHTLSQERDLALKRIAELEKQTQEMILRDYIPREKYQEQIQYIESLTKKLNDVSQQQKEHYISHHEYEAKLKEIEALIVKIKKYEQLPREVAEWEKNFKEKFQTVSKERDLALNKIDDLEKLRKADVDKYEKLSQEFILREKQFSLLSNERDLAFQKASEIEQKTQEVISKNYISISTYEDKLKQITSLTQQIEQLQKQLREVDLGQFISRQDYEVKLSEIDALKQELVSVKQLSTELISRDNQLKDKVREISEERDLALKKVSELEQNTQEIISKNYISYQEYEEKLQQIQYLSSQLEELQQQKEIDPNEFISRQEYEARLKEIETLKQELEKFSRVSDESISKGKSFEEKIKTITRERDLAFQKIAELEKKNTTFGLKGYVTQKEYDAKAQELEKLSNNFERLRRASKEMETREESFKEQIKTIYEEREAALRKIAVLNERLRTVEKELQQRRKGQPHKIQSVKKVKPKQVSAIEAFDNFVRHNKIFTFGFLGIILAGVILLNIDKIGLKTDQSLNFKNQNVSSVVEPEIVNPQSVKFRTNGKAISSTEIRDMVKKFNFYDSNWDKKIRGYENQFEVVTQKGDKAIIDRASRLMWQQEGSTNSMRFDDAQRWIEKLNQNGFAGFHNWRLPTLEEAMSLMEPEKKHDNLYIDLAFNDKQEIIWTSDKSPGDESPWAVDYSKGNCFVSYNYYYNYVRAVRSLE